LISCWYLRSETQLRMSVFYTAASLAGAFSGLLAYAIDLMNGVGGLAGWRWIFLIEGMFTVVVGVSAFFVLISEMPMKSGKWLTHEQKRYFYLRQWYDGNANRGATQIEVFKWHYVRQVATDWKVYVGIVLYWANCGPSTSIGLFMPSIVSTFGYTGNRANLLTVPVYAVAALWTLGVAWVTDRTKQRGICLMAMQIGEIIGCILLLTIPQQYSGPRYFAMFVLTCCNYAAPPCLVAWIANNYAGSWKRALAMGAVIAGGNLGAIIGTNVFRAQDSPFYYLGFGVSLGIIFMAFCGALTMRIALARTNKKRDLIPAEEIAAISHEQMHDMGDKAPTFRYIL